MAKMNLDQLNSPTEQVIEPSNVLDIDTYFDEMYLTESEKEERKDLAKAIFVILSAILTIIKANDMLKNSHNIDYYKEYVSDSLESLFRGVFGSDKYQSKIKTFADEFIDSTMRHIDEPYFTSEDRATVNAEQQSNVIYNQEQYELAVASGKTKKSWVTMHDQRVRKSHDAADGQEVDIDKPFMVGDSELMFPCDLSLGANLREVCNCRCVVVYSGSEEKSDNEKIVDSQMNYAKAIDLLNFDNEDGKPDKTTIINGLNSTPIGQQTIKLIENNDYKINFIGTLSENNQPSGFRGMQQGNNIIINLDNIKSQRVVEQTIIHEVTHTYYKIGACQHAEAVCYAMEKMHLLGRDYLTENEWNAMVNLAVKTYPEYEWEKGGYGDFNQFNFVRKET